MKAILTILSLIVTLSLGAQIPRYIPTSGLMYYYPLNGNANDSSGHALHGTVSGSVSYGLDRHGFTSHCYVGNGRTGINIPNTSLPVGNHARSASVWFKSSLPYTSGARVLLDWGNNTATGQRFGLYTGDSSIGLEYMNASVTARFRQDSIWHNLIVTYPTSGSGSSSVKVYLDGVNQSVTVSTSVSRFNTDTGNIHTIGSLFLASSYLHSWTGSIDEAAIWDRELSACEAWIIAHDSVLLSPITGATSLCAGDSIRLTDATSGGSWSSSNTSIATITSTGVVYGLSAGIDTIRYTYTCPCGSYSTTYVISVANTTVPLSISGRSTACVGDTVTLSYPTAGGIWRSYDTAIATVTATGVVTARAPGTDTIFYRVSGTCGRAVASFVFTVVAATSPAAITGPSVLCLGRSATLTASVAGGTWLSVNPAIASVSTSGTLLGMARGLDTINYSIVGTCGGATSRLIITVITIPDSFTLTGPSAVCVGDSILLGAAVTGGSWSSLFPAFAVASAIGQITGVTAGNAVIRYTVTNRCGTRAVSQLVSVVSMPAIGVISGPDSLCLPGYITLTDTASGGVWSSSNNALATVNISGVVTAVATGLDTISYSATNACGTAQALHPIYVAACPPAIVEDHDLLHGQLMVFPNPARDELNITSGEVIESATIEDIAGRGILNITRPGTEQVTVDISSLPPGIYLLRVNSTYVVKVVKQ